MRSHWIRKTIAFWLGAAGLSLLVASSGFREDELECEQAVAHLVACCPDFPASSVGCEFSEGCGTTTETSLSIEESQCIEQKSCADVVASGLCTKAASLPQPTFEQDGGTFTQIQNNHAPVCP